MSFEFEKARIHKNMRNTFGSVGTEVLNGIDLNESARQFFDGKLKNRRHQFAGTSVGSKDDRRSKVTPFTEA